MDKNSAEKFKKEDRPVWFLGTWSALPIKVRITEISGDGTEEHALVDYICDEKCAAHCPREIPLAEMYESKEDLIAAVFEYVRQKTEEIRASIQTKEDCIRFMYMHTDPYAGGMDWTARHAVKKIVRERWGIDLE